MTSTEQMASIPSQWQDYQVLKVLAQAPGRRTLRAQTPNGEVVIVKELAVHDLDQWKGLELFERELQTLERLNHPRLPQLLRFFRHEATEQSFLYLVLQHLPGVSLAEKLASGWRPDEETAIAIGSQLLEIVRDLHGLKPPVLHRDIKPDNVLLDASGQVYLIDLGSIRDSLRAKSGSTLVGSFGYMAPEQGLGQAFVSSDLYGIGTTMIHLLAGVSPAEMPCRELKLEYQPYLNCSLALKHWLSYLVAPWPDQRYASAAIALEALLQLRKFPPWPELPPPPPGSRLKVTTTAHSREIEVPPGKWTKLVLILLGIGGFALWFALFIWTILNNTPITAGAKIGIMMCTLGAGLGLSFILLALAALGLNEQLRLSRSQLHFKKRCWNYVWQQKDLPLSQLTALGAQELPNDNYQTQSLALTHEGGQIFLGTYHLDLAEQDWLEDVLRAGIVSQLKPEQSSHLLQQPSEKRLT